MEIESDCYIEHYTPRIVHFAIDIVFHLKWCTQKRWKIKSNKLQSDIGNSFDSTIYYGASKQPFTGSSQYMASYIDLHATQDKVQLI